jgi:ammonia channel protein AmtB
MILLGFGFLNSFLKHYSWTGVAITIIGLVLSTEFGLFMLICWRAIFNVEWNFGRFNFQHLLDANLCGASVIISLGAVLGKISMPQYLIFFLTETIGVTFNYTLLRQVIKIIDIGGALTVHLFGAIYGCIYSFISFYSKNERERIRLSPHLGSSYYSNVFAFFGSLIMLSYFPAFNTCLLDDDLYRPNDQSDLKPKYDGMINTYLSILGSIIGTFSMSPIFNEGKFLTDDILHSCYAGGIVVAGCCHLITHYWVPILFGFFTGMLTCFLKNLFSEKLKLCGYHDTTNALFYHGVPGFVGGILTTIFVGNMPNLIEIKQKSYIYKYIGTFLSYYSNYDDFGTDDVKFGKYAGIHFAAIFITIGVALAFGFLAGFTIKFCNCNIAMRYFNDSEFFDVTDCDRFPWRDENIRVVLNYNPRN